MATRGKKREGCILENTRKFTRTSTCVSLSLPESPRCFKCIQFLKRTEFPNGKTSMARKIKGKNNEECDQPWLQKHSETYKVESGSRANLYRSVRRHVYPHEQVDYVDRPKQKPRLDVTLPTEDVAPPRLLRSQMKKYTESLLVWRSYL
jgi:hypothetical protein